MELGICVWLAIGGYYLALAVRDDWTITRRAMVWLVPAQLAFWPFVLLLQVWMWARTALIMQPWYRRWSNWWSQPIRRPREMHTA